jgi:hypothetical protein
MAAWPTGVETIEMPGEREDKEARLKSGRCCWHCRYYIRPITEMMIDGPVSSICTIDREKNIYPLFSFPTPDDTERDPDETCDRFEMDRPP